MKPKLVKLPITLEDLHSGGEHVVRFKRFLANEDGTHRNVEEIHSVLVEPGQTNGHKIRLDRAGDQRDYEEPAADAIVELEEIEHPLFKRENSDLFFHVSIPIKDALCGLSLSVPTITNSTYSIQISDVIKPGDEKRLVGLGMHIKGHAPDRGDMVVKFDVIFPNYLSEDVKCKLKNILP